VSGRTIVVYNVSGTYHALGSICPHQGGPVGVEDGLVTGTTRMRLTCDDRLEPEWIREGEIVRCGWHLYEFDIATGRALTDDQLRLATYPVRVEAGDGGLPVVVVEA
jgi:nitrite reductase/ring-hydroxylating ferredoxin subunit